MTEMFRKVDEKSEQDKVELFRKIDERCERNEINVAEIRENINKKWRKEWTIEYSTNKVTYEVRLTGKMSK